MASQAALTDIKEEWSRVLASPFVRAMHEKYKTLKSDEHEGCGHGDDDHHHHDHHHHSAVDHVLNDLQALSQSPDGEISPEMAQTLYFLQQFVKTEIKALEKDTTLGFNTQTLQYVKNATLGRVQGKGKPSWQGFIDQVKRDHINHLKRELAKLEDILPPDEAERLSKEARIAQRRADKESHRADGFRNWLDGTLSKDQTAVLKALQWETATGTFRPDKIIAAFGEHFVEGHLSTKKDFAVTAVITYLVIDAINFMTAVTGAHQLFADDALRADQIRTEGAGASSNSDPLAGADPLAGFSLTPESQASINARLDEQCLDKFDPSYLSAIDGLVEGVFPESCHEISQGLQRLFEIKTVTPRSLQSVQESWADFILKEGSLAAEQYDHHQEIASKIIEFLAFYDNSLHWFLLAIGGVTGAKLVWDYGSRDGFERIGHRIKQKGALIKERPLPLGMAAASGALYSAYSGAAHGDFVNMGMLPYVLFGAMAGVIAQRLRIHHGRNKAAIFKLHADTPRSEDAYVPTTSLDNERRYALKIAGTIAAVYTAIITANNTGFINRQSPEWIQEFMNGAMAGKAYGGGGISWAIFDRLDDIAYHIAFYEGGIGVGAAATAGVLAAEYGLSKFSAAPYDYKTAWKMAVEAGKRKLQPLVLAARLNTASVIDERRPVFEDPKSPHHYASDDNRGNGFVNPLPNYVASSLTMAAE